MDYKEKYEQALERCRKLYNEAKANEYTSDIEDYETIFPELKESEDEKIRKNLIRSFKSLNTIDIWNGIKRTDILTWLEKQQKPTWSEENERIRKEIIDSIKEWRIIGTSRDREKAIAWLEKL